MPTRAPIPIVPLAGAEPGPDDARRRAFLKVMAASAALAGAGCSGPPQESMVPYVRMPENVLPGRPSFYATAFMRRGLAHGVLVESDMGRPIKVEGNPLHPASLGATDVFAQASVLQLWDPDRSQTVREGEAVSTWDAFEAALAPQRSLWDADHGIGLRILTGAVSSPLLADQLQRLLDDYPNARWHCYDPLHDDAAVEAARLAFGRAVDTLPRLDRAALIVALDADLFGDWPGAIPHARSFVSERRSTAPRFGKRLVALEPAPSLTGAMADDRLAAPPHEIERIIWRVAARLGIGGLPAELPAAANGGKWETVLAARLAQHRGASLIVAGGAISPRTRALVHLLNAHLGNDGARQIVPVLAGPEHHAQSLAALADDMRSGAAQALVMLGVNPVYNAPADLEFAQLLRRMPFSIHLGLYRDETGRAAHWHLPQTHDYEQWSDGLAFDGTANLAQPLIAPLYGGRSAHQVTALLAGDVERSDRVRLRRFWQRQKIMGGDEFESFWMRTLQRGAVEGSARPALNLRVARTVPPPDFADRGLRALFVADPSAGDGEFANNGWLQELPRPFTKLTWDNAALLSPATAHAAGLATGDIVRLARTDRPQTSIEAPVWVWRGHADGVITLPLGYGRLAAGRVGSAVGFDAYPLRTLNGAPLLKMEKAGRRHEFAVTQQHTQMEGRDIVRLASLEQFRSNPHFATGAPRLRVPQESLYPDWQTLGYRWGMAIDLNACIGCNACTIACQAENNIPVVGKAEVMRGRAMHWIRVDRYDAGARSVFQPVPCMHCETAPCEEVCPVGATMHDSEGLNVQVYNRCVGTRFCSNNCPYKVRRFNFLQYSNLDMPALKALQNPEVTVRQRGVMEKCTYCLQRITRARIEAEKLGRRLRDGEVITACQAACPTEAIVFGDLNDAGSKVNRAKASPLDYSLLAELNTRPRTTYAARVANPDRELE